MFSLLFSLLLPCALAAPRPTNAAIHVPIVRRAAAVQDRIANLPEIMDSIRLKYGFKPVNHKRSTTSASLTDEQNDSSYSAVVSIGTPAQEFNLILDTGTSPFGLGCSSDLWVATNQCTNCGNGVPLFGPQKSSTYKNETSPLQITYGSGSVNGYVSSDTVSFSGFSISDQTLLSVTTTSSNLLSGGLSGIMGLGFQTLSSLNTTPFWQFLDGQNQLSVPVFSFYLERYVNQAPMNAAVGGTFTLGGANNSLYTGGIEFIGMPSGITPSFWLQQVQTVTVQGKSISIPSDQGLAAIDTGTTLIGAPSAIAQEIWANVPGSVALGSGYQGMYAFPCGTTVNVSISFGGTQWPISAADMNLGQIQVSGADSGNMCAGGIFDVGSAVGNSQGVPAWIVGDTFLKNVYSVFQANPPAVGFAQLANGLNANTGSGITPITFSNGGIPTSIPGSGFSGASRRSVSMVLGLFLSLAAGCWIAF